MREPIIAHSGIPGMHWGVRRFQYADGSLTSEGKIRYAKSNGVGKKQKGESSTWKSKDASQLSDAELNRRNSRLQREQQYRNMTKSKQRKAAEWIGKTASTILVATAIAMLKGKMAKVYKDKFDKAENFLKNDFMNIDLSRLRT